MGWLVSWLIFFQRGLNHHPVQVVNCQVTIGLAIKICQRPLWTMITNDDQLVFVNDGQWSCSKRMFNHIWMFASLGSGNGNQTCHDTCVTNVESATMAAMDVVHGTDLCRWWLLVGSHGLRVLMIEQPGLKLFANEAWLVKLLARYTSHWWLVKQWNINQPSVQRASRASTALRLWHSPVFRKVAAKRHNHCWSRRCDLEINRKLGFESHR